MINEFMKNTDAKDEKELNEKFQEFMEKYNNNEIEYENTPLDDAYEILEKASNAKTKKQAIKLAKKAYETCPACFDAVLFQVDLEENMNQQRIMLEEGLQKEQERLEQEGFFSKDNIGSFYGIFETRPYIRGLYIKAKLLVDLGKIKKARDVCKEILRLNKNDNMGVRYLLMSIYAVLEEEKEMLKLYKKYEEEDLEMLFPLFALYYKLDDDKKAKDYLQRIHKANPFFVKFFKNELKQEDNDVEEGYYQRGTISEVLMYVDTYFFIFMTLPTIGNYIVENIK